MDAPISILNVLVTIVLALCGVIFHILRSDMHDMRSDTDKISEEITRNREDIATIFATLKSKRIYP
jgi:hypothetical protein